MKFTDFTCRSDVFEKFDLQFKKENFIQEKEFNCREFSKEQILKNFNGAGVFNSEYATCEMIISPILIEAADVNNLPIWSHFKLSVPELDVSGEADYLFALEKVGGEKYKNPIVCIGEAKKENFTQGWGQVAAEMYVAQTLNKYTDIPIYGLVTTGKVWEFAVLKGNLFTLNSFDFTAPLNLDKVFNILNWIFSEGRKNADLIEERQNKEKECK